MCSDAHSITLSSWVGYHNHSIRLRLNPRIHQGCLEIENKFKL